MRRLVRLSRTKCGSECFWSSAIGAAPQGHDIISWGWASFARMARLQAALVGCGWMDNHRYKVGREIWSVWQMALTAMLLSAWSFCAV